MYSTIPDLLKDVSKNELVDLVNDENRDYSLVDLNVPEDFCTARILEQISSADAEIDGYIGSRYKLPLSTIPSRLVQISKDIAIYNSYKRRHRLDMPDSIVSIYKMRIDELKGIQKGTVSLDVPEQPQSMASEIKVNKKAEDRIFNKDLMSRF